MELGLREAKLLTAGELMGKAHDIAKYSKYFQEKLDGCRVNDTLSSHAPLSAAYTIWAVYERLQDPMLATLCALAVYRHHGNLHDDIGRFFEKLEFMADEPDYRKQLESILEKGAAVDEEVERLGLPRFTEFETIFLNVNEWRDFIRRIKVRTLYCNNIRPSPFGRFYLLLLLFSVLIDNDKKAAAGLHTSQRRSELKPQLVELYINSVLTHGGRMADVRRDLREGVRRRLQEILASDNLPRIITLTAPTGSGKTLLGLETALYLREEICRRTRTMPRIIYALPYINIIEQTYDVYHNVFAHSMNAQSIPIDILLKHHHLYVPTLTFSEEKPLDEFLMHVESWESEVVVTTFVQVFETLLGTRNGMLKKFNKLCNAILILDEVQTLRVDYWPLVRDAIRELTNNFNSYVIMMTATKPSLFEGEELNPNPQDSFGSLDRVEYKVIQEPLSVERLAHFVVKKWEEHGSLLVTVNTIRTSIELYEKVRKIIGNLNPLILGLDEGKELDGPVLAYLSTNIVPKERLRRVSTLRRCLERGLNVLAVTTQVVEAGVDLDFKAAIRDIGPLDSIIQVGGRCNREWRRSKGWVYVVKVCRDGERDGERPTDALKIYGKLTIEEITMPILSRKQKFTEREIPSMLEDYYGLVNEKLQPEKSDDYRKVLDAINSLNLKEVGRFRLIEDEQRVPVFIELDNRASSLLREFRRLWDGRNENIDREGQYRYWASLRACRAMLEEYIVETWQVDGLPDECIADGIDIRYVPSERVDEYYDRETGLRRSVGLQATFW